MKTHQPFLCQVDGRCLLLFCAARDPIRCEERRGKAYESNPSLQPVRYAYMPWRVWVWWEDYFPYPLNPDGYGCVECSPYYADGEIRWVRGEDGGRHGYRWWRMPLPRPPRQHLLRQPLSVRSDCGFQRGDRRILKRTRDTIEIQYPHGSCLYQMPVEMILRLTFCQDIPGSLICTGRNGDRYQSFLILPSGEVFRITDAGADVYKCTILGGQLIHAERLGSFENRRLVFGELLLCPL